MNRSTNTLPDQNKEKRVLTARVITGSDAKWQYLNNPTRIDRFLERTVLPMIPNNITPNQITAFRFATIPVIILLLIWENYAIAAVIFVISVLSDAIDGAIARTKNKITAKGIILDPLADKILIGSTAVVLVTKYINPLLALLIVFFEIMIVASFSSRFRNNEIVPAKIAGKTKMILQSSGLILLLLYANTGATPVLLTAQYTLYAAVFFAFLSLCVYRSI